MGNSSSNTESRSSASSGHVKFNQMPNAPYRVLNNQQAAYRVFENAWNAGELNPQQNMVNGRYNNIETAYVNMCSPSSNYYKTRNIL
jgi:hypothetical protein